MNKNVCKLSIVDKAKAKKLASAINRLIMMFFES